MENNKELLQLDDAMMLIGILKNEKYSYSLIKNIIRDLDIAFSNDDENKNREKIIFETIQEKYTPSGKDFAKQLLGILKMVTED